MKPNINLLHGNFIEFPAVGYFSLIKSSSLVKGTWLQWTLGRPIKGSRPCFERPITCLCVILSPRFSQRCRSSVSGSWIMSRSVWSLTFLSNSSPWWHSFSMSICCWYTSTLYCCSGQGREGGRKGRREGNKDAWENKQGLGLCWIKIIM